jgi:hypothetical protein
MSGYIP